MAPEEGDGLVGDNHREEELVSPLGPPAPCLPKVDTLRKWNAPEVCGCPVHARLTSSDSYLLLPMLVSSKGWDG